MKKTKRLSLTKETITKLTDSQLNLVQGGVSITGSAAPTFTCNSCVTCNGTCTTLVSFDHCP